MDVTQSLSMLETTDVGSLTFTSVTVEECSLYSFQPPLKKEHCVTAVIVHPLIYAPRLGLCQHTYEMIVRDTTPLLV